MSHRSSAVGYSCKLGKKGSNVLGEGAEKKTPFNALDYCHYNPFLLADSIIITIKLIIRQITSPASIFLAI